MPRLALKTLASMLFATVFLPACASNFNDQWNGHTVPINVDAAQTIEGRWEGTWQSAGYDYFNGICRAVITPQPDSIKVPTDPAGKPYRVDLQEFYSNVVPREFSFILFVTPGQDGKANLVGEKDFSPLLDGINKFEGDAVGRDLFLSFINSKDYGTITLHRYPPAHPLP